MSNLWAKGEKKRGSQFLEPAPWRYLLVPTIACMSRDKAVALPWKPTHTPARASPQIHGHAQGEAPA